MAEKVSKIGISGMNFKNSNHKKMHRRKPSGDNVRLWRSCPSTSLNQPSFFRYNLSFEKEA